MNHQIKQKLINRGSDSKFHLILFGSLILAAIIGFMVYEDIRKQNNDEDRIRRLERNVLEQSLRSNY